MKNAI